MRASHRPPNPLYLLSQHYSNGRPFPERYVVRYEAQKKRKLRKQLLVTLLVTLLYRASAILDAR